jgi:type VI secretion system secreted protein Hcp
MALFDAFLKLDGIKGESADHDHKGEIDIVSFSWGAINATSIGSATGGAGAGKVQFEQLCFVKKTDASTPLLVQACASGQHLKNGTFVIRKAGGAQLEYLKLTLNLVFVTDFQQQGSPKADEIPLEEVTVLAGSIVLQYQQQGADGKALGGPTVASWNQVKNIENPTLP